MLTVVALMATSMVALAAPATAAVQPATLTVEKTGPSGDDLPLVPGEPFNYVITVQCSYVVPNGGDGADEPLTATIDGIAAPSDCVVTQTDAGGADDTRLTPAGEGDTQAVVTIAAGAAVTVTAYNMFDATDSSFLPITGFDNWAIAIIALVLLAVGAAIAITARRRR